MLQPAQRIVFYQLFKKLSQILYKLVYITILTEFFYFKIIFVSSLLISSMKKIYQCQYCHQYHPQLQTLEKQQYKNSKQAIRFSDLSISHQKIKQLEQINKGQSWEQLKMMMPRAHPQNMTISGRKFKHHWNRHRENKKQDISNDSNKLVDIHLDQTTMSILKRLKTDHQAPKHSQNKLKYCISHEKTTQADKREFSTDFKSKFYLNKQRQRSIHSKQSRQTHYQSISLHKNAGKIMKRDQIEGQINKFSLSGVSESQMISQFHKSALIEKLHESKFIAESANKTQNVKNGQEYCHSMSEYSFSGNKKEKLDYAGEMASLRKVLQKNSHKKQAINPVFLGENCIKIGEKYYMIDNQGRKDSSLYTNTCLGIKMCQQEGETQIIQLPELYI